MHYCTILPCEEVKATHGNCAHELIVSKIAFGEDHIYSLNFKRDIYIPYDRSSLVICHDDKCPLDEGAHIIDHNISNNGTKFNHCHVAITNNTIELIRAALYDDILHPALELYKTILSDEDEILTLIPLFFQSSTGEISCQPDEASTYELIVESANNGVQHISDMEGVFEFDSNNQFKMKFFIYYSADINDDIDEWKLGVAFQKRYAF